MKRLVHRDLPRAEKLAQLAGSEGGSVEANLVDAILSKGSSSTKDLLQVEPYTQIDSTFFKEQP